MTNATTINYTDFCPTTWDDDCPGCDECLPEAAALMRVTTTMQLGYCPTHDHIEVVESSGSGPGFCTHIWWVNFVCGGSEVQGDHIED